jgi:hypothetical protein
MLSGFERLNREVYVLLHLIMPPKNKKRKKGQKNGINVTGKWRLRKGSNPSPKADMLRQLF